MQAKLAHRKVAKLVVIVGGKDIEDEDNEDDKDEHKVFTLRCMNTRSQT
jgi:hypothetical protein